MAVNPLKAIRAFLGWQSPTQSRFGFSPVTDFTPEECMQIWQTVQDARVLLVAGDVVGDTNSRRQLLREVVTLMRNEPGSFREAALSETARHLEALLAGNADE